MPLLGWFEVPADTDTLASLSYNAGGYGTMKFGSPAALAAWRAAKVSHAAYDDWPEDLAGSSLRDETVARRLARIAKGHNPKIYAIQQIEIRGTTVELTYDQGADAFRDTVADLAATLRCADVHGATGTFYFLGTAGAERDFAFALALGRKKSKVTELPRAQRGRAYGAGYRAFNERVDALLGKRKRSPAKQPAQQPALFDEGPRLTKAGRSLYARIMAELATTPDAELVRATKRYPMALFRSLELTAATIRPLLAKPSREESCELALWLLTQVAPQVAVPIAFESLAKRTSEQVRCGALRALGAAPPERTREALGALLATLLETTSDTLYGAVLDALLVIDTAELEARIGETLDAITHSEHARRAGEFLVTVIERRDMRGLARQVADFGNVKNDYRSRTLAARWAT